MLSFTVSCDERTDGGGVLQRRAADRSDSDGNRYWRHQTVRQCVRWRPVRCRAGMEFNSILLTAYDFTHMHVVVVVVVMVVVVVVVVGL